MAKAVRRSATAPTAATEACFIEPVSSRPAPSGPVLALSTVGFLISGSAYLMADLFPLFATEHAGLSPAEVGAVHLLGGVLALSGPAWGWLADHVNHRLVLSLRSAANVGSSLLYLAAPNLAGVAAGKALDDTGKAAFRPGGGRSWPASPGGPAPTGPGSWPGSASLTTPGRWPGRWLPVWCGRPGESPPSWCCGCW